MGESVPTFSLNCCSFSPSQYCFWVSFQLVSRIFPIQSSSYCATQLSSFAQTSVCFWYTTPSPIHHPANLGPCPLLQALPFATHGVATILPSFHLPCHIFFFLFNIIPKLFHSFFSPCKIQSRFYILHLQVKWTLSSCRLQFEWISDILSAAAW